MFAQDEKFSRIFLVCEIRESKSYAKESLATLFGRILMELLKETFVNSMGDNFRCYCTPKKRYLWTWYKKKIYEMQQKTKHHEKALYEFTKISFHKNKIFLINEYTTYKIYRILFFYFFQIFLSNTIYLQSKQIFSKKIKIKASMFYLICSKAILLFTFTQHQSF